MVASRGVELRVIDWNVQGRKNVARQMAFMDRLGWDVLCLQEVRPRNFPKFRQHPGVGDGDAALDHLAHRVEEGVIWGSAILVREGIALVSSSPLANVPSPERTMWATVNVDGLGIDVASLAAPPASSGWKEQKAVQVDRYHEIWASRQRPLIIGMDRNTPRVDHLDLGRCEWFWEAEERLYGPSARHDLRDVLRVHLEQHPDELAAIRTERPQGPLATSFIRGKTPARYDVIYASPEFEIVEAKTIWAEAIEAGSDHGLVWARVRLNAATKAPHHDR